MSCKLFLSHSSKDLWAVSSFVYFMYKIGLSEKDILCSSVPETKISIGNDIYDYLNNYLSSEELYVIFFLSDNYYSSPVCLNEMGAVWLKRSDSLNLLLNGLDFSDVKGVVGNTKIGIKLGNCDSMTKASFNELLEILKNKFNICPSPTNWEIARDNFLKSVTESHRQIDMSFSRSYCIGDSENEGCKIIKKNSSANTIFSQIDFSQTDSKLCDIVIFNGVRNFTSYYINRKNICFEAYADAGIHLIDVELCFNDVDIPYEIYINEDEKSFKIPLEQFCNHLSYWQDVPQIKFVVHRKNVTEKGNLVIKNLRIE